MKFNEALRAMLKGKKVKAGDWDPNEYIMLDTDNNNFIDEKGDTYFFNNLSMGNDWYYSYPIMAGTMLKHKNGNLYKLVVCPDTTYSIVNTETYKVVREHISKDMIEPLLRAKGYTALYTCN
jgi:hypothetical protein